MIVMSIWCSSLSLSSRSLAIALVVCVTLVYFSYSFNACLLASISRSLQQVNMYPGWFFMAVQPRVNNCNYPKSVCFGAYAYR